MANMEEYWARPKMENGLRKIGIIVPRYLQKNRLFQIDDGELNRDDVLLPFSVCRNVMSDSGVLLETFDCSPLNEYGKIIFFCHDRNAYLKLGRFGLLPRSIYVAWEPPTVDSMHEEDSLRSISRAFGRVLTWNEKLVNEAGFGRIRYAQAGGMWDVVKSDYSSKLLVANISSNKTSRHPQELYSERMRILRYFQDNASDEIVMYGPGWSKDEFPSYRGLVKSKANAYSRCKFGLCFENMCGQNGYITEKIFDCFRSGTVPVYCGAPDICKYVPQESFVAYSPDQGPEKLLRVLRGIDEETYNRMLVLGKDLISSLDDGPFSPKAMARDFMNAFEFEPNGIQFSSVAHYVLRLTLRNLARKLR